MTEEFALDLFNLLFDEIKKHSLEGVGTCLMEEFKNEKSAISSTQALNQLYSEAQNAQQKKASLWKLVSSILYYFDRVQRLTSNYYSELEKLDIEVQPKFEIYVSDNSIIDFEKVLNGKDLNTFLKMVGLVGKNVQSDDMPDNILLDELNEIYNAN